ncbi:MAG: dihydrolipoyl dehydrogenase [Nitrospirota bacterium]|nr:dihydrolipoyl dehydrogenase [Nitrospirota bacterium]
MSSLKRLIIIGAGPGGYVAAIRAAQLGAQVTIVEAQAVGGVCLNWGCIPSKTLLHLVDLGERARHAAAWGLTFEGPIGFDLKRMIARKNEVVQSLVKGISTLFKQWNIQQVTGRGELVTDRQVRVTDAQGGITHLEAEAIIVATGSSWPQLPQFPIDGERVISSKEALDLTEIPRSIIIVGGGVEGCEFACLFSGLGSQVTVVEMMPRLLPTEDDDVMAILTREFKKRKIQLALNTTIHDWQSTTEGIQATLSSGQSVVADTMLISVGRRMNSRGLGLETVGVKTGSREEIVVDEHMETTVPGVYAIGDVTGKSMLAHVASAQGKVAVAHALGTPQSMNYDVIPAGIFTLPEIGRVGVTEQQANERGLQISVGRFRYGGLGKAQAVGEITGQFKIIADKQSQKILGMHIIGPHAADLIHEGALAMQHGLTVTDVADMIHAHPTLSEGLMEAAEDVDGLAIHQARKRT